MSLARPFARGAPWAALLFTVAATRCSSSLPCGAPDDCRRGERCSEGRCVAAFVACQSAAQCVAVGPCERGPGRCEAGLCVYDVDVDGACDDLDSCTSDDTCTAAGICRGTPITCATPGATCDDGLAELTITEPGLCRDGRCLFPVTRQAPCVGGCTSCLGATFCAACASADDPASQCILESGCDPVARVCSARASCGNASCTSCCRGDSDCDEGFSCDARSFRCFDSCAVDGDAACRPGYRCFDGSCARLRDADDPCAVPEICRSGRCLGGACAAEAGCAEDTDCLHGFRCDVSSGYCFGGCLGEDLDALRCQTGFHCDGGRCVGDSGAAISCDEPSDCQSGDCARGGCSAP